MLYYLFQSYYVIPFDFMMCRIYVCIVINYAYVDIFLILYI